MDIHAMIVDDSGVMRKMVMKSLRQSELARFTFTEAVDGVDALEKFDPKQINTMFVDWNMPNMSGIELGKRIRATEKNHIPIVMITTEGTLGKMDEAFDDGSVDGYVTKPFTVEVLQKKLEPLFDKMAEAGSKGGFFGKLASKMG